MNPITEKHPGIAAVVLKVSLSLFLWTIGASAMDLRIALNRTKGAPHCLESTHGPGADRELLALGKRGSRPVVLGSTPSRCRCTGACVAGMG
jgi:hypothetical protein